MNEKPKKILLADDEEDIKTIVQMFLETNGYEVITAFDGLDAADKAIEFMPDLILMDIMMPVMDGIEVTRKLKSQEKTKGIPIIMLTAAAQSAMVNKAMQAGAADYLSKPFEPERLQQAIDAILKA